MLTKKIAILALVFCCASPLMAQDDDGGGFEPPPPPEEPPPAEPPPDAPPPPDDGPPPEPDAFDSPSSGGGGGGIDAGDSFQLDEDSNVGGDESISSEASENSKAKEQPQEEELPLKDDGLQTSEIKFHTRDKGHRRMFGAYKIHLGATKPTFSDLKEYDTFYGATQITPTLGVDYFFFDWFATLGFTFRFSYYKDNGHAVREVDGELVKQKDSQIELTLVPLQAGVALQATPFQAKWVVIGGWIAAEALYYQEVRVEDDEETETTTASSFSLAAAEDSKPFVNSGWKMGTVVGASASFMLNSLEERPVRSLSTIGISSVYLTPFMEIVTANDKKGATFGRNAFGLAFSFETL